MDERTIDVLWDDNPVDITQEANFIWSIANKLRGTYMPDKYGDVINNEIRVLKIDNNSYYINEKDIYNKFSSGDYIKADNDENFMISSQVIINGVLVNDRGVENFKNIDIIDKNQEYAIVSENTYNGIKIGDKIALNSVN